MFATIEVEVGQGDRWDPNTVRKEITIKAPDALPTDSLWWAKLCSGLVISAIYKVLLSPNTKNEPEDE